MTAHTKGLRGTGPQDHLRRSRRTKMDRERPDTDAAGIVDADLRGKGREGVAQQRRAAEQLRDVVSRRRRAGARQ